MKKFITEYKALRTCKSESETSKDRNTVASTQDMGVFKWLRRERVSVTTNNEEESPEIPISHSKSASHIGTIRTEEYKRDLAEFQARRSLGSKELPDTPVKKKCGRNSLPSCTDCAGPVQEHDNTFNYEKKSAAKYKKKSQKRRSAASRDRQESLPNIQFLFQNQVFMPGNLFPAASRSEPRSSKDRQTYKMYNSPELLQRHIDFSEDQLGSPTEFFKNNSLPCDVNHFLDGSGKSDAEEVDGNLKISEEEKVSSHESLGKKDDSNDDKLWEVMSELKHLDQWADEQLQAHNVTKSDDGKSDTSYGLPVVTLSELDIAVDRNKTWNQGHWGVVPVQIKRLHGVTLDQVIRNRDSEINILRKCRHPNIILLMGLYNDLQNNVNIICERCVDTLFGIIHVQGRIISAQTSVQYALDIANALVFLRMQGYVYTALNSLSIMVTSHDAAKLAELGPCTKIRTQQDVKRKDYDMYSPEPQYVNIEQTRNELITPDSEPLISQHSSDVYLATNAVAKPYRVYRESEHYRWHAPELFDPDENNMVYPCAKSDVYSLCLVLWECCNAAMPWKVFTYEKLQEAYLSWKTGLRLPTDGTYPGCLLALLQSGLKISRTERIDLTELQSTLKNVKRKLDDLEYVIIPARLTKKKSNFSSVGWDTSPTDDSDCQSPVEKNGRDRDDRDNVTKSRPSSSTDSSEREYTKSEDSPVYEMIRKENYSASNDTQKCCISDEDTVDDKVILKYERFPEKEYSSACSTPIAKIRARMKDIGTPGSLHRSDSTEYCTIQSPDQRIFDDSNVESAEKEKPTAKLSRSFTPKSYKPLHITVPDCNLDSVKSILKTQSNTEQPSYNFDIKNYSLPSTPIARSNKLRKNAWLSGELNSDVKSAEKLNASPKMVKEDEKPRSPSQTPTLLTSNSGEDEKLLKELFITEDESPKSLNVGRDTYTGLKKVDRPVDFSPEVDETPRGRKNSWTFRTPSDKPIGYKVEEEVLARVNVKPLVAIHERWIYEAGKKVGRSMSLPETNRCQIPAVKPASHCVDTLQKSLPQLSIKRSSTKAFRTRSTSPGNGPQWEQFCQARETIAKNVNFSRDACTQDLDRSKSSKKDRATETLVESPTQTKMDQATDTKSIEEFIKDLIRKEFHNFIQNMSEETVPSPGKQDDAINKGVANIVESLKTSQDSEINFKKDSSKSFSRIKINGNNKPLLQITFGRCGENSLQVLDNCVNVTVCDNHEGGKEKLNLSMEETLTEEGHVNSLKRCQAFSAIQEARSTEDLYIDDDLSTQMQENFGGKVKLIPLHGSLHEILCEKEDDCCLVKVKQENGCDTIYFRCDNSDTESRDALDGCHEDRSQDTVIFKRSISLVEERFQRIYPKEKHISPSRKLTRDIIRARPTSDIIVRKLTEESRALSNSSPSLSINKNDDVELNIENVMSYQDSSSDECVKCLVDNDDFEMLERKIEQDLVNSNLLTCLEKISEENLNSNEE